MTALRTGPPGVAAILLLACAASDAWGQQPTITVNGLGETSIGASTGPNSWMRGGLGKLGFGGGSDDGPYPYAQGYADVRLKLDPSLDGLLSVRASPDSRAPLDVLEAYARYQPLRSGDWHWSVKLGAFFPPISLENEAIGWTSPWTLTPSAINSWVGDELRTIGAETTVEKRYELGTIAVTGAVLALNEAAGALLADRGWAFDNRPVGLFGSVRLPDLAVTAAGDASPPGRERPFVQMDRNVGWYGGPTLRLDGIGRATALHYDNRADPTAESVNDVYAWRTRFDSAGTEIDIGDVVVLAQAMAGRTTIAPDTLRFTTAFQSAYLLAGYQLGQWRLAGRADIFATQSDGSGEHGHALTFAATWKPEYWLGITGELLHVNSYRGERANIGAAPGVSETQFQLAARIWF